MEVRANRPILNPKHANTPESTPTKPPPSNHFYPNTLPPHTQGVRMKEPGVSPEEVLRAVEAVHDPSYVAEIKALSERGGGFIDHDTCALLI